MKPQPDNTMSEEKKAGDCACPICGSQAEESDYPDTRYLRCAGDFSKPGKTCDMQLVWIHADQWNTRPREQSLMAMLNKCSDYVKGVNADCEEDEAAAKTLLTQIISKAIEPLVKCAEAVKAHAKANELEGVFHEMSERAEAEEWKYDPTGSGWLSQYADDWHNASEQARVLTHEALHALKEGGGE